MDLSVSALRVDLEARLSKFAEKFRMPLAGEVDVAEASDVGRWLNAPLGRVVYEDRHSVAAQPPHEVAKLQDRVLPSPQVERCVRSGGQRSAFIVAGEEDHGVAGASAFLLELLDECPPTVWPRT